MIDCCAEPGLLSIDDARARLLAAIEPLDCTELRPLEALVGTTLAEAVRSPLNVPPYPNSSMDGYALRAADLTDTDQLRLVGNAFAGHPFTGTVPAGGCVRIMTGGQLPDDCDTVVMQEQTRAEGEQIFFAVKPAAGNSVRPTGEDIQAGATILEPGHRLGYAEIGLLASLGITEARVQRKPVVALFSTGDELVLPGDRLGPGQIYDSNRYALKAALQELAVEILDLGRILDDPQAIRDAFVQADREADLILTSGGVSVGEADFTRQILEELGDTGFWKINIKPGKPLAFGRLPHSYYIGLPGNPVSALVTFDLFARAAIDQLQRRPVNDLPLMTAQLDGNLKKRHGRREFQRGVLSWNQGRPEVRGTGNQSSGVLSSMSQANCYIVLPEDNRGAASGDTVLVLPFNALRH